MDDLQFSITGNGGNDDDDSLHVDYLEIIEGEAVPANAAATGKTNGSKGGGGQKADGPTDLVHSHLAGHRMRGLRQASSPPSSPYPVPTLPYAPTIIFALMSNCNGPYGASVDAMSSILFGNSSLNSPNQTFAGWNQVGAG